MLHEQRSFFGAACRHEVRAILQRLEANSNEKGQPNCPSSKNKHCDARSADMREAGSISSGVIVKDVSQPRKPTGDNHREDLEVLQLSSICGGDRESAEAKERWAVCAATKSSIEQLDALLKYLLGAGPQDVKIRCQPVPGPVVMLPVQVGGVHYHQILLYCAIERLYIALYNAAARNQTASLTQLLYPEPHREHNCAETCKVKTSYLQDRESPLSKATPERGTTAASTAGDGDASWADATTTTDLHATLSDEKTAHDALYDKETSLGEEELLQKMIQPVFALRERRQSSRRTAGSTTSKGRTSSPERTTGRRSSTLRSVPQPIVPGGGHGASLDIDDVTGVFSKGYVVAEPSKQRMEERISLGGTKALLSGLADGPIFGGHQHMNVCLRYADDQQVEVICEDAIFDDAEEVCSFVCGSPSNMSCCNDDNESPIHSSPPTSKTETPPASSPVSRAPMSAAAAQLQPSPDHFCVLVGAAATPSLLAESFWAAKGVAYSQRRDVNDQRNSGPEGAATLPDDATLADYASVVASDYMQQFLVEKHKQPVTDCKPSSVKYAKNASRAAGGVVAVAPACSRRKNSILNHLLIGSVDDDKGANTMRKPNTAIAVLSYYDPLPISLAGKPGEPSNVDTSASSAPPVDQPLSIDQSERGAAKVNLKRLVALQHWQETVLPWLIAQFHVSEQHGGYEGI